jgi:WD repeat-containing protein 40A
MIWLDYEQDEHANKFWILSNCTSLNMETNRESTNLRELVYIRRRPIAGRFTRAVSSRTVTSKTNTKQTSSNNAAQDSKQSCDFVCYSDSEDEEDKEKSVDISCSFVQCAQNRQLGLDRKFQRMEMSCEYATRHMLSNSMMKEYEITVGNMNKVFSSQWLSHKQVIFGTKCNKLMVLDVASKKIDHIPSLESRESSSATFRPPTAERGVNSIEMNPSKTLLTTGATNSNDVAVYRLPTLDPVCVGGKGHQDWIFDQTWIDDQFFVSGSRDGSISLWRITDEMLEECGASDLPKHRYMEPLMTKACKQADKVRALCYNNRTQEIAVISPNSYIHCWNALTMKQIMSKKLPHTLENC